MHATLQTTSCPIFACAGANDALLGAAGAAVPGLARERVQLSVCWRVAAGWTYNGVRDGVSTALEPQPALGQLTVPSDSALAREATALRHAKAGALLLRKRHR